MDNYGMNTLAVHSDNEVAIRMYKSIKFKEHDRKDPNNDLIYMYLDKR